MFREKIVDLLTNKETFRDYTTAEIEEVEKAQKQAELKASELAAKEAARKAIFEKLGLTEEEAAVLLG